MFSVRSPFFRTASALALMILLSACGDPPSGPPPMGGGTPQVNVMTLQPQRLPLTAELSGRVAAAVSAEVRPQVTGLIRRRAFTEGGMVKAGELLYQIDPATYEAAVASAEATLAHAAAVRDSAKLKAARQSDLVKLQAVSKQDAEDADAALKQAEADVAAAEASLLTQRINLNYTRVTAPVAGRIGRSSATLGALVTANQATALATIQQLDPIYVDVTQTSAAQLAFKRSLAKGSLKSGTAKVVIRLEDGTQYSEPGVLEFSETSVDASTGAVTMRVRVPNPRGELLPGMYARAIVEQGVVDQALLLPQQAVTRDATGQAFVDVVDASGKLHHQPIVATRTVGDQWWVSSGLKVGDRIAVEGQQKAKEGQTVQPVLVPVASVRPAASTTNPSANQQH